MAKDNEELETLAQMVSRAVYKEAVYFFELLEADGKIQGNGHHMAQKVAEFAVNLLRERWEHDRQ